jgi:hypothetical protein
MCMTVYFRIVSIVLIVRKSFEKGYPELLKRKGVVEKV